MSQAFRCAKCGLSCEETDNFCRRCGGSLKPGKSFFHSHAGIMILALVAGPFALPLVWTSKRMGLAAKIIYTILLLLMGYYLVKTCVRIYTLTFQMMQSMTGAF